MVIWGAIVLIMTLLLWISRSADIYMSCLNGANLVAFHGTREDDVRLC